MSADWPTLTLGDVCEKITDGAHNSPKSVLDGKPMASVKDLTRFGVDLSEARLISKDDFDKLANQGCKPEVGDVLIAKDGNSALDTVCTVDENLDVVMLSSVAILRPDKAKLDPDFLKYYFCSNQVIQYLKNNFISGAAIPRVVLKDFRRAQIKVPPLDIQKVISKRLRALDDKIELNRQTNQTLEEMAQAVFKSWFVDFEPTRAKLKAKENGQDPERAAMAAIAGKTLEELDTLSPEHNVQGSTNAEGAGHAGATLDTLKSTAALFPDTLVDSELGEIPEGWEVKSIDDAVDTISQTFPLKEVEEVIFLNTGDILEGKFLHKNKSDPKTLPGQAKKSIQKGDILYSEIRPKNKRYAFVHFDTPDYVVSTKLMVLRQKSNISSLFIYFVLVRQSNIDFLQMMAESRSGTFPQITFDVLSKTNYAGPENNEVINLFTKIILNPMHEKIVEIGKENDTLEQLRDTLLPKLLSGELKTPPNKQAIA